MTNLSYFDSPRSLLCKGPVERHYIENLLEIAESSGPIPDVLKQDMYFILQDPQVVFIHIKI